MSQPTKPKTLNLAALAECLRLRADLLDTIDEETDTMINVTPERDGGPRNDFRTMAGILADNGHITPDEYSNLIERLRDSASMLHEAVEIERQIVDRLLAVVETQQVRQFTGPRPFWYPAPYETWPPVNA